MSVWRQAPIGRKFCGMDYGGTVFLGGYVAALVIILIVQAIAFGVAGTLILAPLESQGAGFALGFFLGPVGLVIAWAMRANGMLELELQEKRHRVTAATALARPRRTAESQPFPGL